jgi:hypothetical protein
VLRALEKEPEQRYQTAGEFRTMVETVALESEASSPGNHETQESHRPGEAASRAYNPWETTTIAAGTVFFIVFPFIALASSPPFRVPLIVMSIMGLCICALSLTGLWPFPSPFFPKPNFSSRNLRRCKTSASAASQDNPRFSRTAIVWACALAVAIVTLGIAGITAFIFNAQSGTPTVRREHPLGVYKAGSRYSAMVHHDNVDVHYVIFLEGHLDLSLGGLNSNGSGGRIEQWEGTELRVKSGNRFAYSRDLASPELLHLNGQEFDLRQGRVLVLQEDGKTEQIAMFPTLSAVRYPDDLAGLIEAARPQGGFGPILERSILSENADAHGLVFYRFKDNKVVKPPFSLTLRPNQFDFVELTPELQEWIKSEGADVLFHLESESWAMMTLEMQEGFVGQAAEWNTVSAAKATTLFAAKDARGLVRREVPASSLGHGYSGFSSVKAFRTRDNLIGVYQHRSIKDDFGRGVMIRYKLVRKPEPSGSASETTPEQVALAFMDALRRRDLDKAAKLIDRPIPRRELDGVASMMNKLYGVNPGRLTTFVEWFREAPYAVAALRCFRDRAA